MGRVATISGLLLAVALAGVALMPPPAFSATPAPLGYQLMCLKSPEQCRQSGASRVTLTADVMTLLKRVNGKVNRAIKPKYDTGRDVWSANVTSGDCEDYVLAKRAALIKAGLPSNSLRIAYVRTAKGEGHAILVVRTNGKDLVLDNMTGAIRTLSGSGYRVVSMSGSDPTRWS